MQAQIDLDSVHGRLRHAIRHCYAMEGEEPSLRVFSKEAGIPYRSLQDYLSGARMAGGEALQKLAKKGIDINWVLLGDVLTSNKPLIDKGDYSEGEDIFIADKEMDYELVREATEFMDNILSEMINGRFKLLSFGNLLLVYDSIIIELRETYLRTIEAVPRLIEQKKMSKAEIAAFLRSAIESSLLELVDGTAEQPGGSASKSVHPER